MKKIVIRFNAPVILSFALLSLIALLLGKWTNGATTTQFFSVYRSSLADPLTYVRFFGHVLGHSDPAGAAGPAKRGKNRANTAFALNFSVHTGENLLQ